MLTRRREEIPVIWKNLFEIPNLRFLGRVQGETARRAGVLPLFWTGSGVELCCTGSELHVLLEADFSEAEPWVSAEVNGALLIRTPLNRGRNDLCVFRGLAAGTPKRVRLLRESQPMPEDRESCLCITALGWTEGEFLPLPAPARRLEFVGDSLTSGEGLYGAREEADFAAAWFSAVRGFPQRTADRLGAECRVVSQSGWGLRSDWRNDPRHALPDFYTQVCGAAAGILGAALGAQSPYEFAAWRPDAVVVNLGTNDAGAMENPPCPGPDGSLFQQRRDPEGLRLLEDAAVEFLHTLRRHNPGAKLVWAYGMIEDSLRPCLEGAVTRFCRETGDENAWYLPLSAVTEETMGSRLHPGPACHEAAAETLADFLRRIL